VCATTKNASSASVFTGGAAPTATPSGGTRNRVYNVWSKKKIDVMVLNQLFIVKYGEEINK